LNPCISDRALKIAYREMAHLELELLKPEFWRIGALVQEGKEFVVSKRLLTFNLNEPVTSADHQMFQLQPLNPQLIISWLSPNNTFHTFKISVMTQLVTKLVVKRNS
jgi:hypothetical protein